MSESARFALALVAFVLMVTLLAIGMSPPNATWNPVNGFPLRARLAADAQPPIDPQPPPQAEDKGPQASKSSDIWSGVAGALLGAVIGFAAAWLPNYWSNRRKKQALATGLLNEIRLLELKLRHTYFLGILAGLEIPLYETGTYDQARADLLLFSAETVRALSDF